MACHIAYLAKLLWMQIKIIMQLFFLSLNLLVKNKKIFKLKKLYYYFFTKNI